MEKPEGGDLEKVLTPELLLEQCRHFNDEIKSLQIFMENCATELKSLTELDAEKLTEEQRGDILDCISKLEAVMEDFPVVLDSAKKLREKIGLVASEISG